jgi:predicted DNA-binding transcriptional regulator AlpA
MTQPAATITPDILTLDECAALLRVAPSFVYEKSRRRSRNPLPVHRIGRYLRFSRAEVLLWFADCAAPKKTVRR